MNLDKEELRAKLQDQGYIVDDEMLITLYLALKLEKPLLIEGAPGVGKTEVAKVLANVFETELIRLQCYEGLDENKALYEWNYQRQLLQIQMSQKCAAGGGRVESDIFSFDYLLQRPLLKAILAERRPVLLIDEIDKTDHEFEAFLFEVLSDFQVSIPELGTLKAKQVPIVVLTSNGERELSEGLKRRCVYLYIDYPSVDKELRILMTKVPEAGEALNRQVARAVAYIREHLDIRKKPSIAETLDWARALVALHADAFSPELIDMTLNLVFKNKADKERFNEQIGAHGLYAHVGGRDEDAAF